MIREWLTDWLYWPIVAVAVSGAITWVLNCISVTYSEVAAQLRELRRIKNKGTE